MIRSDVLWLLMFVWWCIWLIMKYSMSYRKGNQNCRRPSTWLHGFCMKITSKIALWSPKFPFVALWPNYALISCNWVLKYLQSEPWLDLFITLEPLKFLNVLIGLTWLINVCNWIPFMWFYLDIFFLHKLWTILIDF